ncbi:hypothetical protein ALI144C_51665 [Actinosynnema sp. ALI-1.44]|uniref:hypothetical protein n=1 Tax=Actinosynnema sp. ALI-1.44 TaxID=1933779 RepID=UPI00097C9D1C|nr:hypothetical protein [Actinosynnema sp. ALI-1.44]ONI71024.1 hypothetical protein ALI144C_51665 [Actinosynnema sp. ALI-1.44]
MADETTFRDALAQHAERRQGEQDILMALEQAEKPVRGRSRYVWVAAGAVALAGAAIVGTTLLGSSPAAYAVNKNADGTVTVSIKDIQSIEPANAKLRELGVRAKAVPTTSSCAPLDESTIYRGAEWNTAYSDTDSSVTFSAKIPEGYTMLLTVSDKPDRGSGIGFTAPVKDPAPSCLLDPADDPSMRAGN